ncbi:hypothetical protein V5O48_009473 [Marasmius crinis-equi]|uniref:Uncharacterized protein n=1 Tax=Marasmius crinis-equi TaxID=585013 RepID=A0ABR3FAZ1_9AGAR
MSQNEASPNNSALSSPISVPSDLDPAAQATADESQPPDTGTPVPPPASQQPETSAVFRPVSYRDRNADILLSWGRSMEWGRGSSGWGDASPPRSPLSQQVEESWKDLQGARRTWASEKKSWTTSGALVHDLNIAHYSRTNDFGWSWEGGKGRDDSLDTLPDRAWSTVQLHRCLKEAVDAAIPAPTFTGPQVMERLQQVERAIIVNQGLNEDIESQSTLLAERLRSVNSRKYQLRSEAEDLRAVRCNMRDLFDLANTWRSPPPPTATNEEEAAGGSGSGNAPGSSA